MKRIKYEVEITYDEKTDMGYIYLVPIQKINEYLKNHSFEEDKETVFQTLLKID